MKFGRIETMTILGLVIVASFLIYFGIPLQHTTGTIELNQDEIAWIEDNPIVRVAYDPNWPPIEYLDDTGKLMGISSEYMILLESSTGLDFETIPIRDWTHALDSMKEGRADMLLGAAQTKDRLEYMRFTEPHIIMSWDMITVENQEIESLVNLKVGTMKNYEIEEWIDINMPDVEYVSFDDHSSAFNALESREVDVFIEVWPVVSHMAELRGIDLYNAGSIGHDVKLSMAFAVENTILGNILQKGLDNISAEQRAQIFTAAT